MALRDDAMVIVAGVSLVALGAWYLKRRVGDVVDTVAPLVNPASDSNLINQGVSGIGRGLTGDPYWTLGGAIYDGVQSYGGGAAPYVQAIPYMNIPGTAATAAQGLQSIGNKIGSTLYDWFN